jgi:predicted house-cleaning noncanonical NTP pyrophosphatase (MazG superfamily)
MSLFKKNTQLIELITNLENKIDILDSKFNSFTYMDGCCDCRTRENKIYTDLKEYLDDKLLELKNSILESVNKSIVHQDNSSDTSSDSSMENYHYLECLEKKLKVAIEEIYNKNRNELLDTLQKCCETHTTTNKTDMFNLFNSMNQNMANMLVQLQSDIKNSLNEKDVSMRTDLQTFLIGVQKDLSTNINSQTSNYINHLFDINNQLTKHIKDLEALSLNIDKNVNSFYYENEIIKHQLRLSEDIRQYSDEIVSLRTLAVNTKQTIDNLLENYEFE